MGTDAESILAGNHSAGSGEFSNLIPDTTLIKCSHLTERTKWSDGVMEWWSDGVVEWWSGGVVEWWSGGVMEWWSDGVMGPGPAGFPHHSNIPTLQYSLLKK